MSPRVSVIIPVFNQERFVKKAIESALNQSYPNIEIIVIDDGSTDNTPNVLEHYSDLIHVTRQKNGGTSSAWNHALEICQTDYVIGLDSDDEFMPHTVEKTVEYALKFPQRAVIYSDFHFIDSWGNITSKVENPECGSSEEAVQRLITLHDKLGQPNNFLPFGHVRLYRRSVLQNIGGYDTQYRYAEDYDLCLRLAEAGFLFKRIPNTLYRYRWHDSNKGVVTRSEQKKDVRLAVKNYLERKKHSKNVSKRK